MAGKSSEAGRTTLRISTENFRQSAAMERGSNWYINLHNGAFIYKSKEEPNQSTPSEIFGPKDNQNIHRSGLERGDDGRYYVCMECQDGGELICCDYCPCTYHIDCLSPPLQIVTEGQWKCPSCSTKTSPMERYDADAENAKIVADVLVSMSEGIDAESSADEA